MKIITTVVVALLAAGLPASAQDAGPPGAITEFSVEQVSSVMLRLTWTNVADDGVDPLSGFASQFWIVYSDAGPVDDSNWNSALRIYTYNVHPGAPGSRQLLHATGFTPGIRYWFTIWVADETVAWTDLGWSAASVSVSCLMKGEIDPPAKITTLDRSAISFGSMTIAWTAPGDDADAGTAARYDLRMSDRPILTGDDFAAAAEVPNVPVPLPAGSPQHVGVDGLDLDTTYHFALKAADEWENWSALSVAAQGTTLDDLDPPARVGDVTLLAAAHDRLTLTWTAPADNDRVARYEVRYSAGPLQTDAEFERAIPIEVLASGSTQVAEIGGLAQHTTYHVAVRASDRKPNWSARSSSIELKTAPGGSEGPGHPCGGAATGSGPTLIVLAVVFLFLGGSPSPRGNSRTPIQDPKKVPAGPPRLASPLPIFRKDSWALPCWEPEREGGWR